MHAPKKKTAKSSRVICESDDDDAIGSAYAPPTTPAWSRSFEPQFNTPDIESPSKSAAPMPKKTPLTGGVPKSVSKACLKQGTPAKTPTERSFKSQREPLAQSWYQTFNTNAFQAALPNQMELTWSNTLNTTAGRALLKRRGEVFTASIELSTKVLDSEARLRNTLCHEMCHVAAWVIDHTAKPAHGPMFKKYAARAMRVYPDLDIKTCHSYQINFKFQYQCTNDACQKIFGRHSKSIDTDTHGCSCGSKLQLLPRLKVDGTPAKKREAGGFAMFVKDNYASVKASNPGVENAGIMKLISAKWAAQRDRMPLSPVQNYDD